jgi:hypothetical protein
MHALAAALLLAALPASGGGDDLATPLPFDDPLDPQEVEQATPPPEESLQVMEYIYSHSHVELGFLWTHFDADLDIEPGNAFYARYGVGLARNVSIELTYRHYDFSNSDMPGPGHENVGVRAILAGLSYRLALTREVDFFARATAGFARWETAVSSLADDTGPLFSVESAFVVHLSERTRFKIGAAADFASTEFHLNSSDNVTNLSGLIGIEIGR